MSQLRKMHIVDTLLTSTNYYPKEIARRADVSLATVYLMKSQQRSHSKLEHTKGAGRPKTLRNRIKPSLCQQIRGNHFYPCGLSLRKNQLASHFRQQGELFEISTIQSVLHQRFQCLTKRIVYIALNGPKSMLIQRKRGLKRYSWMKRLSG